jgi:hypothetical protein
MHIPWRDEDLQRAEVGGLKFTRQQAERMRRQVAERLEAELDRSDKTRASANPGSLADPM